MFPCRKNSWKKWAGRAAAAVLCICLSATGIYDYVIILRDNDSAHRMTVNMESSLTDWLSANLKKNDLLLTPEYTMNEVTMSGAMLYCGWPYYAWSAGYDTGYRAGQAVLIYTTDDPELLKAAVNRKRSHISCLRRIWNLNSRNVVRISSGRHIHWCIPQRMGE